MKNEHYKLIRDLFHAVAIAALGIAFFLSGTPAEWRIASVLFGFYCHLLAHVAVLYDRKHRVAALVRERWDEERAGLRPESRAP